MQQRLQNETLRLRRAFLVLLLLLGFSRNIAMGRLGRVNRVALTRYPGLCHFGCADGRGCGLNSIGNRKRGGYNGWCGLAATGCCFASHVNVLPWSFVLYELSKSYTRK